MGRLKVLKFDDYNEMMDYYTVNENEIHLDTLNKLEECYAKHNKVKTIDVYKLNVEGLDEMEYMSILEDEWDLAFMEMKLYFVNTQQYELAARARNLEVKVFNIQVED